MRFSQRGISLLEILLVVAIAATIVTGAVLYYSQTVLYAHAAQAVNLIQQINKGGYDWLQITDDTGANKTDFSNISLAELVTHQLIPCENNSCAKNPWGGTVTVTANKNNKQFMEISLSNLSQADCARMIDNMRNIAPQDTSLPKQNYCQNDTTDTTHAHYYVSL